MNLVVPGDSVVEVQVVYNPSVVNCGAPANNFRSSGVPSLDAYAGNRTAIYSVPYGGYNQRNRQPFASNFVTVSCPKFQFPVPVRPSVKQPSGMIKTPAEKKENTILEDGNRPDTDKELATKVCNVVIHIIENETELSRNSLAKRKLKGLKRFNNSKMKLTSDLIKKTTIENLKERCSRDGESVMLRKSLAKFIRRSPSKPGKRSLRRSTTESGNRMTKKLTKINSKMTAKKSAKKSTKMSNKKSTKKSKRKSTMKSKRKSKKKSARKSNVKFQKRAAIKLESNPKAEKTEVVGIS